MAKPICVIYFPDLFVNGSGDRNWIYQYMRFLNGEQDDGSNWKHSDHFTEYYWFCFYKQGIEEPEFKVFHEKDFTEIQFEELKKLVTESLSSNGG
jgi:hypothetical protein